MTLVLADTSVWTDHLRSREPVLDVLVQCEQLLMHPYVIGELAMGNLKDRTTFIRRLHQMEMSLRASEDEVAALVEGQRLHGSGLSWIDAHLLASVLLMDEVRLWTRDRRLNAAAERLGISAQLHH